MSKKILIVVGSAIVAVVLVAGGVALQRAIDGGLVPDPAGQTIVTVRNAISLRDGVEADPGKAEIDKDVLIFSADQGSGSLALGNEYPIAQGAQVYGSFEFGLSSAASDPSALRLETGDGERIVSAADSAEAGKAQAYFTAASGSYAPIVAKGFRAADSIWAAKVYDLSGFGYSSLAKTEYVFGKLAAKYGMGDYMVFFRYEATAFANEFDNSNPDSSSSANSASSNDSTASTSAPSSSSASTAQSSSVAPYSMTFGLSTTVQGSSLSTESLLLNFLNAGATGGTFTGVVAGQYGDSVTSVGFNKAYKDNGGLKLGITSATGFFCVRASKTFNRVIITGHAFSEASAATSSSAAPTYSCDAAGVSVNGQNGLMFGNNANDTTKAAPTESKTFDLAETDVLYVSGVSKRITILSIELIRA